MCIQLLPFYFSGSILSRAKPDSSIAEYRRDFFAIGFLMRPIGGWIMGTYADRKGP